MAASLFGAGCFGGGGQPIVFVSEIDGDAEVALLDPETGKTTRVTNNSAQDLSPVWSRDRSRILYLSDESGNAELHVADPKGGTTSRLTFGEIGQMAPLWGPKGDRVAFIGRQDGNPEIYVARGTNGRGGSPTRITFNEVEDHLEDWSPDGEWLVFYATGPQADPGLWLRNPRGVNLIRLTKGNDAEAVWSPDGRSIALVRIEDENSDIYLVTKPQNGTWRDDVEEVRLTQGAARDVSPTWAPDNKSLAFVSFRDGNAEIYSMRIDGSKQRRLTNNEADDLSPVWSPDGKHLAFVSYLYGPGEIIIMDADQGRQIRLTNNNAEDSSPDW